MRYTDINFRPYALVDEVKEGTVLVADSGFICDEEETESPLYEEGGETYCIKPWSELTVKLYENQFYIDCACGCHFLSGQYDSRDDCEPFYLGLYKKEEFYRQSKESEVEEVLENIHEKNSDDLLISLSSIYGITV